MLMGILLIAAICGIIFAYIINIVLGVILTLMLFLIIHPLNRNEQ